MESVNRLVWCSVKHIRAFQYQINWRGVGAMWAYEYKWLCFFFVGSLCLSPFGICTPTHTLLYVCVCVWVWVWVWTMIYWARMKNGQMQRQMGMVHKTKDNCSYTSEHAHTRASHIHTPIKLKSQDLSPKSHWKSCYLHTKGNINSHIVRKHKLQSWFSPPLPHFPVPRSLFRSGSLVYAFAR